MATTTVTRTLLGKWNAFPASIQPRFETATPDVLRALWGAGESPHAIPQNQRDQSREIDLVRTAKKLPEPVAVGYHDGPDGLQILYGHGLFRAAYEAGFASKSDYIVVRYDKSSKTGLLRAAAWAHEFRHQPGVSFPELVKIADAEGIKFVDAYGEFLSDNKADRNTLREAYEHGFGPYLMNTPFQAIRRVLKDKLASVLSGRITHQQAIHLAKGEIERELRFIDAYGVFLSADKANKADRNTLREAYEHGFGPYLMDTPFQAIRLVVNKWLVHVLSGKITHQEAIERAKSEIKTRRGGGKDDLERELRAAFSRADRTEKKAEAMNRCMDLFLESLEKNLPQVAELLRQAIRSES